MTQLLALLRMVGNWINRYLAKHEQQEKQESRDELERDPNAWFDDHFAGADSDERVQSATDRTDAEANKAHVGAHSDKATDRNGSTGGQ